MKKKILSVLAFLLLCGLVISSCGPSETPSEEMEAEAPEAEEEIITLEYWTYADIAQGAGLDYLHKMIAKFQETHPNVNVNITGKGDDDLLAGLIASAASDTMPDLFQQSTRSGAQLKAAGAVNNIYDRWMAMPEEYRAQFDPSKLALVMPEEGVMYAIPHTGYGNLMYRNLKVLEAAGIDPNEEVDDWDEWLEQMKQISEAGFIAVPDFSQSWFGYASIYAGVGTREEWAIDFANDKTLINPENYAKAAEFIKATKPYASNLPCLDQGVTDLFIADQLAFYFCGSWCDPTFVAAKEASGLEYDWALIPGATAGKKGGVSGYELISIATQNPNADLAWEFATFLTDYYAMYELGQELGRYNANAAAMADVTNPLIAITFKAAEGAVFNQAPFFVEPWPSDYFPIINENMIGIYEGMMTPEEGAQQLIVDLNEMLASQ